MGVVRVWVIVGAVDLIESRVASVRMAWNGGKCRSAGVGCWVVGLAGRMRESMVCDIGWQGVPLGLAYDCVIDLINRKPESAESAGESGKFAAFAICWPKENQFGGLTDSE